MTLLFIVETKNAPMDSKNLEHFGDYLGYGGYILLGLIPKVP